MASPPPKPPGPFADIELDHYVGAVFAYVGLGGLALAVLFQLPSFLKHVRRQGKYGYIFLGVTRSLDSDSRAPRSLQVDRGTVLSSSRIKSVWWSIRKILMTRAPLTSGLSIGKLLILLIYIALAILLSFYKNPDETSLINYERFGFLALAQVPITFGLAMKNSPLGYLIGEGYEKLNFLHRFTGRLMFLFGLVHWALLMRLQIKNTGHIKLRTAPYCYGFAALASMLVMGLMGWRVVRQRFYQLFLATHVLGYVVILACLWYHVNESHKVELLILLFWFICIAYARYISVAVAFVVLDHLLKLIKTRFSKATMLAMPSGLTRIEVPGITDGWRAGQHVFIRVLKGRNVLEKHPFTIANAPGHFALPMAHRGLVLVAKVAGSFTQRIHGLASESSELLLEKKKDSEANASPDTQVHVLIEGPYGAFFYDFTEFETVFLCAGGSGMSFCMSLLEEIVGKGLQGRPIATRKIEVVWIFRDPRCVSSYEESIAEVVCAAAGRLELTIHIKLYLTTSNQGTINPMKNLTAAFHHGRPEFKSLLAETAANSKSLAVGVCGPLRLVDSVQVAVKGLDASGLSKIAVHSERFGW